MRNINSFTRRFRLTLVLVCVLVGFAGSVSAQAIPPPSGPVVFCGTQQAPLDVDSYQLVFDGGAPEALTMDATLNASCPTGSTHSFSVPAARFTVGQHTLRVDATNAFGTTQGPAYTVTVGIAPGPFEIIAVIPPAE